MYNQQNRPKQKEHFGWIFGSLLGIVFLLSIIAVIVWGISFYKIGTSEVVQHGVHGGEEQAYGIHDSEQMQQTYEELSHGGEALIDYQGEGLWGTDMALDEKRALYSPTSGDASDTWTIMVYIVGSDLESYAGAATSDLEEMMDADLGDHVQLLVQTGGASYWYTDGIDEDTRQRFEIRNGRLREVDDIGSGSMSNTKSVADFLKWGTTDYPADHYGVIFWDHGGGTEFGYGYDELYEEILSLEDMKSAFDSCGEQFAFVGFDACLMQTVGTAYMLEPYADYLFGSEDVLPGEGWYYTSWLEQLAEDPGMSTLELGARITDATNKENGDEYTFSVLDLREIKNVYTQLMTFYNAAGTTLADKETGTYTTLSTARAGAKCYGGYDQIDAIDMIRRCENLAYSNDVIAAMQSCIKYRNNSRIKGNFGLAMFYPTKRDLDTYSETRQTLIDVAYHEDYVRFLDNYVTILSGGNITNDTVGTGLTGYTEDTEDYSTEEWFDDSVVEEYDYEDVFQDSSIMTDSGLLALTPSGNDQDDYMLEMTEEMWNQVTDIQLQCLLTNDDLGGYIDLGSDQYWEEDEDNNLIVTSDDRWTNVDGYTVAYYATSIEEADDGRRIYNGTIPAILNGKTRIDIYVSYLDDFEVLGYLETDSPTNQLGKGYKQLRTGDTLDYVFTFYSLDGTKEEDCFLYDQSDVVTADGLDIYYDMADTAENTLEVCYQLTDVYGNQYYTEMVEITFTDDEVRSQP